MIEISEAIALPLASESDTWLRVGAGVFGSAILLYGVAMLGAALKAPRIGPDAYGAEERIVLVIGGLGEIAVGSFLVSIGVLATASGWAAVGVVLFIVIGALARNRALAWIEKKRSATGGNASSQ